MIIFYWILIIALILWIIRTAIAMYVNRETYGMDFLWFMWLFFIPIWWLMEVFGVWSLIDKCYDWIEKNSITKTYKGGNRKIY